MTRCPCCRQPIQPERILVDLSLNTIAVGWVPDSVRLSPQQAEVALLLAETSPAIQPRDRLIYRLWGTREINTARQALDVHIHALRKLIKPLGLRIENGRNRGFRMVRA